MTNILKPELLWIEGRCYRINESSSQISALQEHDLYESEDTYNDVEDDGDEEDDFPIEKVDENRYSTSLHVSKHYTGYLIGKKGATKYRVERDTRTEIKIPKQGQTGDIVIFGSSIANVKAARRRINIIVMSSRLKQKSTHFISIPMNSSEIMRNFEKFKESVLHVCGSSRGLDESLFIRAQKLHLTLGVLCLMDNEERLQASKILTGVKENVIMPLLRGKGPVKIRLKGLSYMNDDPREIDVLYGLVQEEGSELCLIQTLADSIVDHFSKLGFMQKEYGRESVKLHVTLINSKYRKHSANISEENGSGQKTSTRETFDGSQVLEKFANYDFGVTELTDFHLSQRHSMGPDGYYQPTCIITCKSDM